MTGAAGFIGYSLSKRLLARGDQVIGLDNFNNYYDVNLKEARANQLAGSSAFHMERASLEDADAVRAIFKEFKPQRVVNLAAQAGVRYSLTHPEAYISSNLVGFLNILEACRHGGVEHLVFASSSSVYGANGKLPFSVQDNVDHPVSLYAATKRANEMMAHSYSHLYRLPTTGLRFFTVYGPWGRPDMALFLFTKQILAGETLRLFNYGKHRRDFTYIDDIVEGVVRVLDRTAAPDVAWDAQKPNPATSNAPYRIYNIGNQNPVWLEDFVKAIENRLGKKAQIERVEMQMGDVVETCADVEALVRDTGFQPNTSVEEGVKKFVDWYLDYYQVNT